MDRNLNGSHVNTQINQEHDYVLMEQLIENDLYTDKDLQSINICRIYFY